MEVGKLETGPVFLLIEAGLIEVVLDVDVITFFISMQTET